MPATLDHFRDTLGEMGPPYMAIAGQRIKDPVEGWMHVVACTAIDPGVSRCSSWGVISSRVPVTTFLSSSTACSSTTSRSSGTGYPHTPNTLSNRSIRVAKAALPGTPHARGPSA
jgi:hypothetical protein